MATISHEQWEIVGRKLFGDNKQDWQFQCPMCGLVQSIALAKEQWPELEVTGWQPWAECVGRYLEGVGGCDWAAYGLFQGPLLIEHPETSKPVLAFDFAHSIYEAKGMDPLHGPNL